jgi:hypothetical protein
MKKILKAIRNFPSKVWYTIRAIWDLVKLNLQNPKILWASIVNKVEGK